MTDTPTTETTDLTAQPRVDQTAVPAEEDPHVCPYCGMPFAREQHLALHRGLDHYADLTDKEREAFDAAYADEDSEIHRFRIVALGVLVLLYFFFLFAYAIFAL